MFECEKCYAATDDNQMEITLISNDSVINNSNMDDNWMEISLILHGGIILSFINIEW